MSGEEKNTDYEFRIETKGRPDKIFKFRENSTWKQVHHEICAALNRPPHKYVVFICIVSDDGGIDKFEDGIIIDPSMKCTLKHSSFQPGMYYIRMIKWLYENNHFGKKNAIGGYKKRPRETKENKETGSTAKKAKITIQISFDENSE